MPVTIERQPNSTDSEFKLPIEVAGIIPSRLVGKTTSEIAKEKIRFGRNVVELGELFRISGKIDETKTINWTGDLNSVHHLGAGLDSGTMQIKSSTGRHVGAKMSGGQIEVSGDVSDFLGVEMTGGTIRVHGSAGDCVGGNYNGSKFGMNRGEILIDGNAGRGCGQAMRRGLIAVGGKVDRLCGWNMLAGSIVVMGNCGAEVGAGMLRGSIVLAGETGVELLPTFARGGSYSGYVLGLTAKHLKSVGFQSAESLAGFCFTMHHGDCLRGGRGEIFCRD